MTRTALLVPTFLTLLTLVACVGPLGVRIDRSLSGLLNTADVSPRGTSYLLRREYTESTKIPALPGSDQIFEPAFIGLTIDLEPQSFRLSPGPGSFELPSRFASDSRSLYQVPGTRDTFVLEYNFVDDDDRRQLMATIAERRCQGDLCVLAIAHMMPVGSGHDIAIPPSPHCARQDCGAIPPLSSEALAAAISEVAERVRRADAYDYFLLYETPAAE
jgi:hypothetical protein